MLHCNYDYCVYDADLCLSRIVSPIHQALEAIAVGVLLGLPLLGEMPFVVGSNSAHMGQIILIVLLGILLGVLLQDLNDLTTAGRRQLGSYRQAFE